MKLLVAMALALAMVLAGCGGESGSFDKDAFSLEVSSWDAVEGLAISENGRSIWVGVTDTGSSRDGYAMSVCEAVREHSEGDLSNITIEVIDAKKMTSSNQKVELGRHRCKL